MLDITHTYVDVETVWCGITDSAIFVNFYVKIDFLHFASF